jgi:hypothetical protein
MFNVEGSLGFVYETMNRIKTHFTEPFGLNPVANRLYVTGNGSARRGSSRFA